MGVACNITLNKPKNGVFVAGYPVTGVVKYAIDEPTEYKDVELSLIGEGDCSWYETEGNADDGFSYTRFSRMETYVSERVKIANKKPRGKIILNVGSYEYPFVFHLPNNIPSSFEGSHGNITYRIVMKFERSGWFGTNKQTVVILPVYARVKPLGPEHPISVDLEKSLFKPFSKKDHTVKLEAKVDRALLFAGETAKLSLAVTNDSDVTITSIRTEVVCYTIYRAKCGTEKEKSDTIQECTRETASVACNTAEKMTFSVPISPALCSIQNSWAVRRYYKLRVTLRLPVPHLDVSAEIPVVIGMKTDSDVDEVAIEAIAFKDPPPTYWEAVGGDKKDQRSV